MPLFQLENAVDQRPGAFVLMQSKRTPQPLYKQRPGASRAGPPWKPPEAVVPAVPALVRIRRMLPFGTVCNVTWLPDFPYLPNP
jgi:hypothetical protein